MNHCILQERQFFFNYSYVTSKGHLWLQNGLQALTGYLLGKPSSSPFSPEARCVLELQIKVEWSREQLKEREDLIHSTSLSCNNRESDNHLLRPVMVSPQCNYLKVENVIVLRVATRCRNIS